MREPVGDAARAGMGAEEGTVSIVSHREGDTGVVVLGGELDLLGGDAVEAAVAALVADGASTIAVDAGGVTFLDSSGLGGLLAARAVAVDAGGELRLGPVTDGVSRVIELAGVWHLLDPTRPDPGA
jgi:anti-anti-sigma factor